MGRAGSSISSGKFPPGALGIEALSATGGRHAVPKAARFLRSIICPGRETSGRRGLQREYARRSRETASQARSDASLATSMCDLSAVSPISQPSGRVAAVDWTIPRVLRRVCTSPWTATGRLDLSGRVSKGRRHVSPGAVRRTHPCGCRHRETISLHNQSHCSTRSALPGSDGFGWKSACASAWSPMAGSSGTASWRCWLRPRLPSSRSASPLLTRRRIPDSCLRRSFSQNGRLVFGRISERGKIARSQ